MGEESPPRSKQALTSLKATNRQVFLQTLALVNSAFALVAALAWNEAVKSLIDHYFKSGSDLYSRFIYAIIITILVVIVTSRLTKLMQRFDPEAGSGESK